MSVKHKKQFGVWMDTHHATVVGRKNIDEGDFEVLGHIKNPGADSNSNENAAHHQEIALTHKFFKEITHVMPNVDIMHIVGTGKIQEQFIHYLAETPQYKHTQTSEGTQLKMSDEHLVEFFHKYFH